MIGILPPLCCDCCSWLQSLLKMGNGAAMMASLPDLMDKQACENILGESFNEAVFNESADPMGFVTKEQVIQRIQLTQYQHKLYQAEELRQSEAKELTEKYEEEIESMKSIFQEKELAYHNTIEEFEIQVAEHADEIEQLKQKMEIMQKKLDILEAEKREALGLDSGEKSEGESERKDKEDEETTGAITPKKSPMKRSTTFRLVPQSDIDGFNKTIEDLRKQLEEKDKEMTKKIIQEVAKVTVQTNPNRRRSFGSTPHAASLDSAEKSRRISAPVSAAPTPMSSAIAKPLTEHEKEVEILISTLLEELDNGVADAYDKLTAQANSGRCPIAQALLLVATHKGGGNHRGNQIKANELATRAVMNWMKRNLPRGSKYLQFIWGYCHYYGIGFQKDEAEACKYYQLSAEQNYAVAQYFVGNCYRLGKGGLSKDEVEAVKWFQKSADQNYSVAIHNLGLAYRDGRGGLQEDTHKAFELFKQSGDMGYNVAVNEVAECYRYSIGLPEDKPLQADSEDNFSGSSPSKKVFISQQQQKEREKMAFQWYKKAAELGNAQAQDSLGDCYWNGIGVAEDTKEAEKWYEKSAEQGNAKAQYDLATCYYDGVGVDKDRKKAARLFRRSADQHYADAQYSLGVCYASGEGVAQSEKEAQHWFKLAADQGNEDARKRLHDD